MSTERPVPFDDFLRTHVRTEDRLLIQSTCKVCGRSQVVSNADGSLQNWESTHDCKKAQMSRRDDSPAA